MAAVAIAVTLGAANLAFKGGAKKVIIKLAADATVGHFMARIREFIPALTQEEALFAFWGGVELAAMHTPLSALIIKHKARNGQIPVILRAENAFG